MTRTLVKCLMLSVAAGLGASALTVWAGFGWLVVIGAYCAIGSVTLVSSALAVQTGAPRAIRVQAQPAAREAASPGGNKRAYA